jgi:hypothetical protein
MRAVDAENRSYQVGFRVAAGAHGVTRPTFPKDREVAESDVP